MRTNLHPALPTIVALAIGLFSMLAVRADGIPVAQDRKRLSVESVTLTLTTDQMRQVERHREVTLTEEQRAPLRVRFGKLPATLPAVSSRYNSCTCEMPLYAVWCRPGEVDLPVHCLADFKELAAQPDESLEEEETDATSDTFECLSIILDQAGLYYRDGKATSIEEIASEVEAMYQRRKKNEKLHCSVFLDTPPPINEFSDGAVREAVDVVNALFEKRYVALWAPGFIEP